MDALQCLPIPIALLSMWTLEMLVDCVCLQAARPRQRQICCHPHPSMIALVGNNSVWRLPCVIGEDVLNLLLLVIATPDVVITYACLREGPLMLVVSTSFHAIGACNVVFASSVVITYAYFCEHSLALAVTTLSHVASASNVLVAYNRLPEVLTSLTLQILSLSLPYYKQILPPSLLQIFVAFMQSNLCCLSISCVPVTLRLPLALGYCVPICMPLVVAAFCQPLQSYKLYPFLHVSSHSTAFHFSSRLSSNLSSRIAHLFLSFLFIAHVHV